MAAQPISLSKQQSTADEYTFHGGYPTADTVQRAYYEADLNSAIQAYKFFYPSVSLLATWIGNAHSGLVPNKTHLRAGAEHFRRFLEAGRL